MNSANKIQAEYAVNEVAQETGDRNSTKVITKGMPELIRRVAAQGTVMLENRILPFEENSCVAVFGRTQINWFLTGYGSGGDVNYPYSVDLLDGLRQCEKLHIDEELASIYAQWVEEHPADPGTAWANWPRFFPEMPLSDDLIRAVREKTDKAVVVIGRSSGEDRESLLVPGSFYLTDEEKQMLRGVTEQFPDAVLVLNIGSIMDMSFLDDYSFGAVLIPWQGGMESGNAVADILCGKEEPAGRLSDTIAMAYKDYPSSECFGTYDQTEYKEDVFVGYRWFETFAPERVRYPFGYGMSYTEFEIETVPTSELSFDVTVRNVGKRAGQDTVMLFVEKPSDEIGNPARELVAFAKTKKLLPGESQQFLLSVSESQLVSYDDCGQSGHRFCYVMQKGNYNFYCGENVRSANLVGTYHVINTKVAEKLRQHAAPQMPLEVLAREHGKCTTRLVCAEKTDLKERILENIPCAVQMTDNLGYTLQDVAQGKVELDDFIAQLDLDELEALSRGGYTMDNPWGIKGNTGVFGGVTESLRAKGIPTLSACDGPSGLRMYDACSLIPIGTLLACTFDTELVESLLARVADEMKEHGADVMLAPGMNVHRNPLCGRNFEYFSEDPYLTGKIAAAYVRGVQTHGASACPKHFACNNQETNRLYSNSVLSERALREIYLKGFEICVKEARPKNIMTSYNKINGVWGHYHYELVHDILRGEWKYQGNVMTDWWMRYAESPEFTKLEGNAYRVRACVDLLMPGARTPTDELRKPDGTLLASFGEHDGITLGEIQESARNILKCILSIRDLRNA